MAPLLIQNYLKSFFEFFVVVILKSQIFRNASLKIVDKYEEESKKNKSDLNESPANLMIKQVNLNFKMLNSIELVIDYRRAGSIF